MSRHFTHLHVHTDFSLLDGAIALDKLIAFGKQNNCKALAISDHGNIFGAVKFFQQCKSAGIKPVLGIEAYLTEDARLKDAQNKYYHLIIVVENAIGYKNLCKLISYAYTDGFYFKPRIDYKMLAAHSEGLTVTTACLGGHIPTLLMQEQYEEAERWADWYLKVFGPERFYLEVQPEDQKDQKTLNDRIWQFSAHKSIKVVATGDCHYVSAEDREAHEIMLAIQTHHKLTDPDRFTFGDCRVHLRSTEEMLSVFKDHEEAVWASGDIVDRCNFEFQTGKLFFPQFQIPEAHTQESYFRALSTDGLQHLIDGNRIPHEAVTQYWDRLNLELDLIITMGFIGYLLVVSDFIQWARRTGIPVGPGRGSVAGSLVAWALQITDIDPIKYNLLFERFLNPERVSMPDIDIDFCIHGRDRVINYVRDKYGHDKVCQIITFGTMMAKGVIKDVARALGFPFEDSNALTELIPDQLKITLKEALDTEPRLKKLLDSNPQVARLFDVAFRLEGLTRHASKHAAGIVISPEPISEMLPIYVPSKTTDLVTQYAMTELEYLGFLKMDFLGLKNLTLIERVVALIAKNYGTTLDITRLPLDDQKTFELLCRGDTSGVFQLESDGIKDVLRRLQPHAF
jgi:DNA polymerase-3 subunit alpha